MKILIVKTSSMGDIIHALPVAYDIKAAMPTCQIHWIAEESFREIPRLSPGVEKTHVTAFRRWRKHPFAADVRAEIDALKKELRAEKFDVVLDIQGLLRSGLLCHWTKAPTWGYTWKTARESLASLFYNHRLDLPEEIGAVRRYRVAAAQTLNYSIDEDHPRFALEPKVASYLKEGLPYVALAVNTSRDEKLWPAQNWVSLANNLRAQGLRVALFWGSERERERVEAIAAQIPDTVVVPRMGLEKTAATLAQAVGVIGVDTGLTHLGAALGRPSVGIFVSTPTETLKLYGDGPVTSLGGIGVCPGVSQVETAFNKVLGETL